MTKRYSSTRGFARTSKLLNTQIREAGEKRGFAVSKLLTHWAEVVGQDIASVAQPIKIGYGRGGMGGTLTLLTTGAQAPMLEMQKDVIRTRVNACYGYNAIARVHITQTAPTGFAEGQAQFLHAPRKSKPAETPEIRARASELAEDVGSPELRAALERLARNVYTKTSTKT
jgi:hypothetical protein